MPVTRGRDGRWRYRESVLLPDGTRERISGSAPKHCNTKAACKQALQDHRERLRNPEEPIKEVPTFSEWFEGRFWREWVIARKNKPSEQASKQRLYKNYVKPYFGDMQLDEVGVAEMARFRASLLEATQRKSKNSDKPLSDKYINNILAVVSKALRYAEDVQLIARAPKVGILKTERPEIECWTFDEYARVLCSAAEEGPTWRAAVCLAGEGGLRVGEVKGLRWRQDVDLVAGTLTVNRQIQQGKEGTPKGRTRRVVPMTPALVRSLRDLGAAGRGYVVCNDDGSPFRVGQVNSTIHRICRRAGLPERGWHLLRHCFGTHAAMFGVNPWSLMNWMGHKRIDETMRYVHVASAHRRPLPQRIIEAGAAQTDPDHRVVCMLSARSEARGNGKNLPKTVTEK